MSIAFSSEDLKNLFNKVDKDGHGHLSLADVERYVAQDRPNLLSRKHVIEQAFKEADKSGNDSIELDEFARLIALLQYYQQVDDVFKQFDTNNDKRISFSEFKKGFELIGDPYLDEAKLGRDFDSIDTDHSGYIQFDEFCMYMAKKHV